MCVRVWKRKTERQRCGGHEIIGVSSSLVKSNRSLEHLSIHLGDIRPWIMCLFICF